MPYQYISVERDNHLTIVTIERAEVHNALNASAHRELEQAFDDFAADPDQWVAIITGAGGKAFCAGHDLKQQVDGGGLDIPETGFGGLTSRFNTTKPLIAAVNGVAMGGGFEMVLACDIVVAAENARFALPEPLIGLAPLAGGYFRLPREIGMKRAMGMLLTGRRVTAQEGYELGFVNEVVAEGEALSQAKRFAAEILKASPLSVRATKEAAYRGEVGDLEVLLKEQWQFAGVLEMLNSDDAIEGPAAFVEKRPPVWKAR